MRSFWEFGYERASISMLEEAAGVDRKQLARDYGNKRGLYLQALDDFAVLAGDMFIAPLERPEGGLEAIRGVLDGLAHLPGMPDGGLGCMICNASREPLARSDEEVARRVRAYFERIERGYRHALDGAHSLGEVDVASDRLEAAARHLFAVHVSVLVLACAGTTAPELRDITERAVASVLPGG